MPRNLGERLGTAVVGGQAPPRLPLQAPDILEAPFPLSLLLEEPQRLVEVDLPIRSQSKQPMQPGASPIDGHQVPGPQAPDQVRETWCPQCPVCHETMVRAGEARAPAGTSKGSSNPNRRHPVLSSHVCALATARRSAELSTRAVPRFQPSNQRPEEARSSSQTDLRRCRATLSSTYRIAFRTSRGVFRTRRW